MTETNRYFIAFQEFEEIAAEPVLGQVELPDGRIQATLETATLTVTIQGTGDDAIITSQDWAFLDGAPILEIRNSQEPLVIDDDATFVVLDDDLSVTYSGFDDIISVVPEPPSAENFLILYTGRFEEDYGGGFDVLDASSLSRSEVTLSEDTDGYIGIEQPRQSFVPEEVPTTFFARNHEKLQLSDGAYIFDLESEDLDEVYRLYDAAFARTPDEPGLRFWVGEVEEGNVPLADLPDAFIASPEFAELYGEDPTDEEFVTALYDNVLRRPPDEPGLTFWTEAFASGELGRDDMLAAFSESDENVERNAENLDIGVWVI